VVTHTPARFLPVSDEPDTAPPINAAKQEAFRAELVSTGCISSCLMIHLSSSLLRTPWPCGPHGGGFGLPVHSPCGYGFVRVARSDYLRGPRAQIG